MYSAEARHRASSWGLGAVEIAAAGIAGRGEVQHGHVPAEPAGGLQAAFARDLDPRRLCPRHPIGGYRHRFRPVQERALARRPQFRRDADLAPVRRAVGARRDDLLGLLGDAAQARAHGATPVRAVSACRAAVLVVLTQAS